MFIIAACYADIVKRSFNMLIYITFHLLFDFSDDFNLTTFFYHLGHILLAFK